MRRTALNRNTQLTAKPEKVREFLQRGRENRRTTRRAISPASPAQRAYTVGQPCLVCGRHGVDPAHLIDRSLLVEGQDDPRAVVPLCRTPHHILYDRHELDLLPYLEPRYRVQLAFAVERFGLISTLERVTGTRWRPAREDEAA